MGGPGTAQAAGLTCRQASPPHLTSSHELPETHASGARLGEPAQGRMKGHPQGLTHPPKYTHASQTPSRQAEREIHVNTEPPTAKGSRAAAPKLQVWGEGRTNSPRDPWDPGRDPWDPRRGPGAQQLTHTASQTLALCSEPTNNEIKGRVVTSIIKSISRPVAGQLRINHCELSLLVEPRGPLIH